MWQCGVYEGSKSVPSGFEFAWREWMLGTIITGTRIDHERSTMIDDEMVSMWMYVPLTAGAYSLPVPSADGPPPCSDVFSEPLTVSKLLQPGGAGSVVSRIHRITTVSWVGLFDTAGLSFLLLLWTCHSCIFSFGPRGHPKVTPEPDSFWPAVPGSWVCLLACLNLLLRV